MKENNGGTLSARIEAGLIKIKEIKKKKEKIYLAYDKIINHDKEKWVKIKKLDKQIAKIQVSLLSEGGKRLRKYIKAWKPLYIKCNNWDTYSNFTVYYKHKNDLIQVWYTDFMSWNIDYDDVIKTWKKEAYFKTPAYVRFSNDTSKTLFTWQVNAIGTSRTLEIVLNIWYALNLSFSEIKQNYITL